MVSKLRRQDLHVKRKKTRASSRRKVRFDRKREENRDPTLREERLARNVPHSIDKKRVWDDVNDDGLNASVDVEQLKRRRIETEEAEEDHEDDVDSMLGDSDSESTEHPKERRKRASSVAASTASTNLDLTPDSLKLKFPTLFSDTPPPVPKILLTTSLQSTLHKEAHTLCTLFPNTTYIPRTSHRYGHKFSLKDIVNFSAARGYTAVILLHNVGKSPSALSLVHLPAGPTFHFSITNWLDGKKLPGHGNPTNHYPEMILNNFRTPLGLLTARMFLTLFPPQPELQGRQVVTFHNQRDYIFLRKFRYNFRLKRDSERSVVDHDGKPMEGVEDLRTGMQELGPRMTLKLRRIDKGVGRMDKVDDEENNQHFEWKPKLEKQRTRFNL